RGCSGHDRQDEFISCEIPASASSLPAQLLSTPRHMEENGMKQVFVMLSACFFLVWGLGAAARAQSVSNKDEGSSPSYSGNERGIFRILFNGEQIGEEKFQIVADASNFRAFAEISLTVEREKDKATFTIKPLLQFKKTFEPISYEVLQESGPN